MAGYNIYYGVRSGAYTNMIPVGNVTNAAVGTLVNGTTYYFAATSVSTLGLESVYSTEISYAVPNVPQQTNWLLSVSVQQSTNLTTWNTITNIAAFTVTNNTPGAQFYWRSLVNIQPQ